MKSLNKIVLASAVAAISAGALAELKALNDSDMSQLTGQAGLTIDIETKWTIGEFAYKDGGSVLFQGLSMGGRDSGVVGDSEFLDNFRLTLDVADASEDLHYGFSDVIELADTIVNRFGNTDLMINLIAAGATTTNTKKTYGDGDLVIHMTAKDWLDRAGGFEANESSLGTLTATDFAPIMQTAVDFKFSIDAVGLAASTYEIGSSGLDTDSNHATGVHEGAAGTTTLFSGLSMQGYLGPIDIHIENNGNGFDGAGNADSEIHWDTYTNVTDLDIYIDIAGVQISDMKINNSRGDVSNIDGNGSFGFAHSKKTIYAVKDAVLKIDSAAGLNGGTNVADYVDGIAINTEFKGDMEIGALSFGDSAESIGELYWTDIRSTTNWVLSAH